MDTVKVNRFINIKHALSLLGFCKANNHIHNYIPALFKSKQDPSSINIFMFYNLFTMYMFGGALVANNESYENFCVIALKQLGFVKPTKYLYEPFYDADNPDPELIHNYWIYTLTNRGLNYIRSSKLRKPFYILDNLYAKYIRLLKVARRDFHILKLPIQDRSFDAMYCLYNDFYLVNRNTAFSIDAKRIYRKYISKHDLIIPKYNGNPRILNYHFVNLNTLNPYLVTSGIEHQLDNLHMFSMYVPSCWIYNVELTHYWTFKM